ncbi:unnamed protein product [Rangifer tarandus platyrhynchus]|uniref:Uncharacterized protein n=1 Tax=Rangifer tarandus platyrhynchus TaxID=3082113 RepID=A0ABN8ZLM3_RANTA|nr:unnamed protein product [Rangifer tarandus platyrhynchus]
MGAGPAAAQCWAGGQGCVRGGNAELPAAGGREHCWPLEGAGGRPGKLLGAAGSRGAAGTPCSQQCDPPRTPPRPGFPPALALWATLADPARPLLRSQ